MKKFFSIFLTALLLLTMPPVSAVAVSAQTDEVVVNVKDFGAKGDGVTSDYSAIVAAFNYAIANYASKSIPVTVYFPEGEYGLKAYGMYINLPFGSGNLTIKGDGADKSTIVYLDEWVNGGSWVALRLQLEGEPSSLDDYMHDITIQDLGVYDTDPVKHAWHVDKGDPATEETHGFNIQYCVRATIKNCKVDSVGDEALDMSYCIDSVMTDNLVLNSPGAGGAGGAISVGDGSQNVRIANNTIIGSINTKTNWAIAVEALAKHVENITIENNTIQDVAGYGINIGAPAGTIADVLVQNNTIEDCSDGGIRLSGSGQTNDVHLIKNTITSTKNGIYLEGSNKDGTLIENCTVSGVSSHGVKIDAPSSNDTLIQNTVITNCRSRAVYNAGTDTKIDHVLIDGVGLSGSSTVGAITQYVPSGTTTSCSEVTNTVILNCQNKYGTQGVQIVRNTLIEQMETSGYISCSGASLIKNCKVNRFIRPTTGGAIEGAVLFAEADLGLHAVYLNSVKNYTITDSVFMIPSRYAIYENGTANNNTVTNNVTIGGQGIKVIGTNTVATGNATGAIGVTEHYRYRIVDGKATITECLDKSLENAIIPSTIEECPVVAIDPWAFVLCDKLISVTIPAGVTEVGANAFYLCDALTNVNYFGTTAEWESVTVGDNNDALLEAAWYSPFTLYSDTVQHSVMDTDNGNGLAFRFELNAANVGLVKGNQVSLSNATVDYFGEECKLVGMGVVVTNDAIVGASDLTLHVVNGKNVLDVPTVYLQDLGADYCVFATRIINIPTTALNKTVYARPYCILEVRGELITVYGRVDMASCAEYL